VTGYIGFDLTATSLHVGNLDPDHAAALAAEDGHRPITLMGGGTTKVGDPSGKDETRKLLTVEQIDANIAGIRKVFALYLLRRRPRRIRRW
jgi:tyrosyl-tRNA synthetase